jgi:protein dithiol oxidoreductase (disulfide-forming)
MKITAQSGRRRFLHRAAIFPVLAWLPAASATGHFQEGVHYRRLPAQSAPAVGRRIEVLDFFWYGCPACYNLLPSVQDWRKRMPDDVDYQHVPAMLNEPWMVHARAYYVAEALGVAGRTHGPLFDAIHRDRRRLDDERALATFFSEQGVNEAAFADTWSSFGVEAKLGQATQRARRYRISGVPTMIVGGTFLTSPSMAGNVTATIDVLDYLVDKVRRGEAER